MLRRACVRLLLAKGPAEPPLLSGERGCFHRFSHEVERSTVLPGVFWLKPPFDCRIEKWGAELAAALPDFSSVAVGFSRFGSFVVATRPGLLILKTPEEERALSLSAPLRIAAHCAVPGDAFPLVELKKLGVGAIGDYLRLPVSGLRERYGEAATLLHRIFHDDLAVPREAVPDTPPLESCLHLENPETDATRLLFHVKALLDRLLFKLASRGEALAVLHLDFTLDRRAWTRRACKDRSLLNFAIRPARETLDNVFILDLLRLQIERAVFKAAVLEIRLLVESAPGAFEQLQLFRDEHARDERAASDALDRVRAALSQDDDDAVAKLRLRDAHLPEAKFAWLPLALSAPPFPLIRNPRDKEKARDCPEQAALIRKIHPSPREIAKPAGRFFGPHIISGGWWAREVHREYYFVETGRDLLWVYYDRIRKRWFLQ